MSAIGDLYSKLMSSIVSGAPHLQAYESELNTGLGVVATVIPAAAPVVGTIEAVEAVGNTIVSGIESLVGGTTTTTATTTTPASPLTGALPDGTAPTAGSDTAAVAAATVSSSETDPTSLASRVMTLESTIVSILPSLSAMAKELGL